MSDEEFARWRFAYIDNLRKPDYLEDDEVVAQRFARLPGALASTQEVRVWLLAPLPCDMLQYAHILLVHAAAVSGWAV